MFNSTTKALARLAMIQQHIHPAEQAGSNLEEYKNQSINRLSQIMQHLKLQPKVQLIGLFGGTFDPIHNAHIEMIQHAKKYLGLDQLWVIPCYKPAHGKQPVASAQDRLKMLRMALSSIKDVSINTCEYDRQLPSKTIDTLRFLHNKYPNAIFCFIIGMDGLNSFTTWYEWENILKMAHLAVANRPGYILSHESQITELLNKREIYNLNSLRKTNAGAIIRFPGPDLDMSSTAIRSSVSEDNVSRLIPASVQKYIDEHHLYHLNSTDKKVIKIPFSKL